MAASTSEISALKKNGWKFFIDKELSSDAMINMFASSVISNAFPLDFTEIKSSESARVLKFSCNNRWYIFKEYLKRSPLEFLKAFLKGSRAEKAWNEGHRLIENGIATPGMPAYGEKIFFGFPTRNFLITDFLSDSYGFYTFLKTYFHLPLTVKAMTEKRAMIYSLGKFIGHLHAKGIFHGDLRLDNIIISRTETGGHNFFLIDNERNRYFSAGLPAGLRERNLMQINMVVIPQVTTTDRLRFFKAYLKKNPGLEPHAREWIFRIFLLTRKRLSKKFPGIWNTKT